MTTDEKLRLAVEAMDAASKRLSKICNESRNHDTHAGSAADNVADDLDEVLKAIGPLSDADTAAPAKVVAREFWIMPAEEFGETFDMISLEMPTNPDYTWIHVREVPPESQTAVSGFSEQEYCDKQDKGVRKCPKCGSREFLTERRLDGDSTCSNCGYKGKTK